MNEDDLKHLIEATLLAAGRPVTMQQLLQLFDERERPTPEQLQAALESLAADYGPRGIELLEVASGWRIQVRPRCAEVVSRLWQERPSRYSRALLETLALIAYRQPITRSEIEEIRGVSISSTIMRTLQERSWIRTVGHREVPGRPELLGTTRDFLDYFGLKTLEQLPTLAELKDVETIGVQLELPQEEPPAQTDAAGTDESGARADAGREASQEVPGDPGREATEAGSPGESGVASLESASPEEAASAVSATASIEESSDVETGDGEMPDTQAAEMEVSDATGADGDDETTVDSLPDDEQDQMADVRTFA
jgi:segregation and condensation protein B